jgi:hypothetical protein
MFELPHFAVIPLRGTPFRGYLAIADCLRKNWPPLLRREMQGLGAVAVLPIGSTEIAHGVSLQFATANAYDRAEGRGFEWLPVIGGGARQAKDGSVAMFPGHPNAGALFRDRYRSGFRTGGSPDFFPVRFRASAMTFSSDVPRVSAQSSQKAKEGIRSPASALWSAARSR